MATSKEFDFMGYLHFDVTLDGDAYGIDVYNKLDARYADRAHDDGALITHFDVPVQSAGPIEGLGVVDVKNRMYLTNTLDESLAPVRMPVRFNPKENKYEFYQAIRRVNAAAALARKMARHPDILTTQKTVRGK